MKKFEADILYGIEKIEENNQLINVLPKTPQQRFMINYATLHFLNKGHQLPILYQLLQKKIGSTSQLLVRLKYMKQCMENKVNLDNKEFHVLNTLVLWMQDLEKTSKSNTIKLVNATLLPHPHQLKFQYYEEYIIYLNYLAVDIQNLFKSNTIHWSPDDLILFLQISLPRIYFNIILPPQFMENEKKEKTTEDRLFCNCTVQYFTRTRLNYRGLCKLILTRLIDEELTSSQCRHLIDIACRYYLLFWSDSRQNATQLFLNIFNKCTEAVKFSLTDELLLFFKVCQKLQAKSIEQQLRPKCEWIDSLLTKYNHNVIGHPKDDVNPYNPLNLKEKITVDAGKSIERVLEIYKDQTIFYFTVLVGDNDINLRLFYLGDFESKIEVKKLLHFDQKKSGENRYAYMAGKRGLYMLQFDNSYSWINSKTVTFQYVILTPYQQSEGNPIWYNKLFELNTPTLKREPLEFLQKIEKPQIAVKQNIEVHKLQEIYSSDHYQQELIEEEEIHISTDSPKTTLIKPHEKSRTIEIEIKKKREPVIENKQQEDIKEEKKIEEASESKEKQNQQEDTKKEKESETKKEEEGEKKKDDQREIKKEQQEETIKENETQRNKEKEVSTKIENQVQNQKEEIETKSEKIEESIQNQITEKKASESDKMIEHQKTVQESLPQTNITKRGQNFAGQANLSLIDNIFSLLVSTYDHTYQFQTNLQDRIGKRLRSYCGAAQPYQWIINSEARDWLKKNGFSVVMKAGVNYLTALEKNQQMKRQSSSRISKD